LDFRWSLTFVKQVVLSIVETIERMDFIFFSHPCLSLDSFGFDRKFRRMRLLDFSQCFSTMGFDIDTVTSEN